MREPPSRPDWPRKPTFIAPSGGFPDVRMRFWKYTRRTPPETKGGFCCAAFMHQTTAEGPRLICHSKFLFSYPRSRTVLDYRTIFLIFHPWLFSFFSIFESVKMSKLVDFPTSLPSISIPQDTKAAEVVASFAPRLANLEVHDFKDDAIWRDIFALTGTIRTFYTAASISAVWNETNKRAKAGSFIVDEQAAHTIRTPSGLSWIQVRFSFETGAVPKTTCTGLVTFALDTDGKWRIWTLRTILEQLKGQPNVDVLQSVDRTAKLTNGHGDATHFDCIIIGGGQAGLSEAGRLKALGISYVVLDKYQEVGDNWKQRYGSARCMSVPSDTIVKYHSISDCSSAHKSRIL
jgi:hypothetical protein